MNDEIKEILDYFQKDVDKYEESKKYLMEKYGYDEETINNISQHKRHINTKILLDYITNLQQENQKYKEVFDKLKEDLNLIIEYGDGEDASRYDKQYGEFAKNHLKYIDALLKEVE